MRITFVALGTRGDVQPYIALGIGLRQAGYNVRIATHQPFQTMVERHDLEYAPLAGDPQAMMGSEAGHRVMDAASNPFLNMLRLYEMARPLVTQMIRDALAALTDTDLAIGSALGYNVAFGPARSHGIPLRGAFVQPILPTAEYPISLFPGLPRHTPRPLERLYNRLSYPIFMATVWLIASRIGNPAYRAVTGLPAPRARQVASNSGLFNETLIGYSRHVVPKPADWPDRYHVCGYWFLDESHCWQPPADLQRFLDAGTPPVYIGFGSMSNRQPVAAAALAIDALRQTGQRGLLLTGWHGLDQAELPDTVFKIDAAPHDWLFPRMAALVHHGGSGTTGAALRSGVPQLVVPFSFEQPFWGDRTERLGVGVHPIPRRRLTVDKLASAIDRLTHDAEMRQRAQQLAIQVNAENGVDQAVAVINTWLNRSDTIPA